jgi:putative membrane protein
MKTSTRIIRIVAAVAIGLVLLAGGFLLGRASLGTVGYGLGMRVPYFGFGVVNRLGFGGIIPFILPILFWGTIIALGVWLISGLASRPDSQTASNLPPTESAVDILKKRYARGEITKEQFDQMSHEVAP